mgnify:FL=1|jgi:hypothetical protein
MENNAIAGFAGLLLSLLFGYVPGLRDWYEALDGVRKAQVMAGLLLLAAGGLYAAACYTPWSVGVTCGEPGLWQLLEMFLAALVANQAAYLIGVRPARTG